MAGSEKPTVRDLGIDVARVTWQRSGPGAGSLEVAFVREWVLMRTANAPGTEVLVFDHGEWDAFVRGVKDNEFDDAAVPHDG